MLNDQDLHDINEIKDYEQMAEVRMKQGITKDEEFLLDDFAFLLPHEIKDRNRAKFEKMLGNDSYYLRKENPREVNGRLIIAHDEFVTIERGTHDCVVYLRLPNFDLESSRRGLR
jgi:hypothetical protein